MQNMGKSTMLSTRISKLKDNLNDFVSKISSEMYSEIYESFLEKSKVSGSFEFGECFIDIEITEGYVEVSVIHENERHISHNIEKMIEDRMPKWYDVEKDYNEEKDFKDYLWNNCRFM